MKPIPNQAKIIKVSTVIRHVMFAGVVVWIIGVAVMTFQSIHSLFGAVQPARYLTWGLLGIEVLRLVVTWQLFRFFDRLKTGHFFDAQTVRHLAAAGKWWIVLWLYDVLMFFIRSGIFKIDDGWKPIDPATLFAGLVMVFIAWLLKEAQGLQEEQELTV